MAKDFHSKPFGDATQIKLELFQRYIRKWLPTFMTRYSGGKRNFKTIRIYDFFSGPGYDSEGNPGSPIIIVEELKKYCSGNKDLKAEVKVQMYFNDIESENIKELEINIAKTMCKHDCCKINYSELPFKKILQISLPDIQRNDSANLIIMDQFGVKDVTPETVSIFSKCKFTDIIFFISSSYIYRFKNELGTKFGITSDDMKNLEYNSIHRFICDHFKAEVGQDDFYLSPFSIKKGQNIYGIIFGSGRLRGLEKFLQACWEIDPITGESNYDIDDDIVRNGATLFPEMNISKKLDIFKKRLMSFLEVYKSNNEIYRFTLENGCLPSHANDVLTILQKNGSLEAEPADIRKRSFYLTWDYYKINSIKAKFRIKK